VTMSWYRPPGSLPVLALLLAFGVCFATPAAGKIPGDGDGDGVLLKEIRAGRHALFNSVVFEFDAPFEFLPPSVEDDEVRCRLVGVSTGLQHYRKYRAVDSWVRMEEDGGDIAVSLGLPADAPEMRFLVMEGPPRLVVNLYRPKELAAAVAPEPEPPPVAAAADAKPAAVDAEPVLLARNDPPPAVVPTVVVPPAPRDSRVTVSFRDVSMAEAFEMLSRKERVNVVLGKGVTGQVNCNLYDVPLKEAIIAIADSAGYGVLERHGGFIVLPRGDSGQGGGELVDTVIRTYKLQYAKPAKVEEILSKHLSGYGKVTFLKERNLLIVEDLRPAVERLEMLLRQIDRAPRQIRIEAKILEVTLDDSETFGLDWAKLFSGDGGDGTVGLQGFASPDATGFIAKLVDAYNVSFVLNALSDRGRVHTLSTPKLLALEDEEASVIIGDRQGYKVTTTINQVTTESIEFLESGVILKVTPSIDDQGRILMAIHPEVSTGTIQDGLPSQTTTEVETELFAQNGRPIFIGGLIKSSSSFSRAGVPFLGSIPGIGRLFSSTEEIVINTETIILITPYILTDGGDLRQDEEEGRVNEAEVHLHVETPPREWDVR